LPTYQYRCTECDHAFEEFQSFTDDALTVCPVCGGRLRKVYNAVGVVFKGSGFYRNDSRGTTTSSETPAAKTSDASASSSSSSSSTTDSSTSTSSSSTSAPAASGGSGSSTT
jgi:putative FmdB family regulatory protein